MGCPIQLILQLLCNYNYIMVAKVRQVLIKVSELKPQRTGHEYWKSALEIVANEFEKYVTYCHPEKSSVHGNPMNPMIKLIFTKEFQIHALCHEKQWLIGEDPLKVIQNPTSEDEMEVPCPQSPTFEEDLELSDGECSGSYILCEYEL